MEADLKNISKVETFLNELLDNKVSNNTFFTDFPLTINKDWADMVLVDCEITDLSGYGNGFVYVYLYAKPMSTGGKPVKKLSQMESMLNKCIESNNDKHYILQYPQRHSDYDEQRNLFVNVVIYNLLIV